MIEAFITIYFIEFIWAGIPLLIWRHYVHDLY